MMAAWAVKEETMAMACPLMICYNNKSTLALLLLLLRLEPQSQQLFPLKLFQSLALKESPFESLCFRYCSLFSAAAAAVLPLPLLPSLSLPPLPALLLLLPLAPNFSLLSSFSSGAIVVHLTLVPERFHDYPFIIISISELRQNAATAAAAAEIE
jgi:hypothetical protein